MCPSPPPDIDAAGLRVWALEQLRHGATQRSVAMAAGVGKSTIARWAVAAAPSHPVAVPAAAAPPYPAVEPGWQLPAVVPSVDEDRAVEIIAAADGHGWTAATPRRLSDALGLPIAKVESLRDLRVIAPSIRWLRAGDEKQRASLLRRIRWLQHKSAAAADAAMHAGRDPSPALGQLGRALSAEARLLGLDQIDLRVAVQEGSVRVELTYEQAQALGVALLGGDHSDVLGG